MNAPFLIFQKFKFSQVKKSSNKPSKKNHFFPSKLFKGFPITIGDVNLRNTQ